ncbi:amino acid auxin permease family [Plasmopara halstedii]|uniref:Amino acid auxin permease family n=1 Tax=Plasmopara halstedii TaxID=4781 RepID=A0A0P1AY19_PLAHL|nr:amino acid auxin permease family [Plasmopara halstedii]CEG45597.1 amino acid auxin permease family [Plasmopara halstedii]|eukprot:XP_024581966.1 amino acid auxin permease family [Plasmopara halstedii]
MGSCLLMPCVFLVLGGGLLDGLFPGAWDTTTWIILMTITVLPLALVPTLKEGAGAAFAGTMGTIVADFFGVAIVVHGMRDHPSVPTPELSISQIVGAFGSLAMGFGAGIVLSDVQRQHSDPTRMPRVVVVTMTAVTCLLLILGLVPYLSVGCQVSGNLLYVIYPDDTTGLTTLGFAPKWGTVVLAYLAMQIHVTIAFSVLINPAFYIAERLVLGMHQRSSTDIENGTGYQESATLADLQKAMDGSVASSHRSRTSVFPLTGEIKNDHDLEAAEYRGANAIKYIVLRLTIIVVLVVMSILFKDHFSDFVDFVGASAITANCIVLPTVFYLTKTWNIVPMYEKFGAGAIVVVCTGLGLYSTFTAGKNLFAPGDSDALFPYCEAEFQDIVYFNQTA